MNLQLTLVQDAYPSQYRTHALAAIMSLWSRAYVCLDDAMLVTTRGSYAGAIPLVRAACELIAAEEGLRAGEHTLYNDWLKTTLRPDERFKAFEFELGRYFAGEVIAAMTRCAAYRASVELARPFRRLLASGRARIEQQPAGHRLRRRFVSHRVGRDRRRVAARPRSAAGADRHGRRRHLPRERRAPPRLRECQARVSATLSSQDRGRIEEVDDGGEHRLIVHNFRRSASGAPKKYLLLICSASP